MIPVLILALLPLWQDSGTYKLFYREGKQLFEQGQYEQAAAKFREAYRLNSKPEKYRLEGTYWDHYQPRYWLALTYEKMDILQAQEWAEESLVALEVDIAKRRKIIAKYNEDLERINIAAENFKKKQETRFKSQLAKAQSLMERNRFEEAEQAFNQLLEQYPDRLEARTGLSNVAYKRESYVNSQLLEISLALSKGRIAEAQSLLAAIEAIDPNHAKMAETRTRIEDAIRGVTKPEVITETEKQPQVVVKKEPVSVVKKPKPEVETPRNDAFKAELMETLGPYQLGNPTAALAKLHQLEGGEDIASYHWLMSLYLMSEYHQTRESDPSILERARQAMKLASQLEPAFSPDPSIYPEYVIEAFLLMKSDGQ